jgi:hypothetical protein
MKSRGAGRDAPIALSVRPAVARPAPPAPVADCAVAGCIRPAPLEPVEDPGEGADAEAGIVAGCFAHPLATRIRSAAGTIRTLLIG